LNKMFTAPDLPFPHIVNRAIRNQPLRIGAREIAELFDMPA